MKTSYDKLIKGNEEWVQEKLSLDPNYFVQLAKGQEPNFLWIGCSDSRVPANEITKTQSGEIFVHRNIANQVIHSDTNMLSVLQYAIEYLHVKHVIVCGHYGCGGVKAAMSNSYVGLVGRWLAYLKDIYQNNKSTLDSLSTEEERENKMVELNVIEQVHNLAKTSFVQKAWMKRELEIHGWVYSLNDGKIIDLNCKYASIDQLEPIYRFSGLGK
ncbi:MULTISPECIES: carbonic anhydrase [Reichenbachiella]|uniref:carbonic anhydrase n=1 Tax=Reichenbachiella TaxID=156993 RepID=UPI000E6C4701|nr:MULTISPECIES: carbonic anhydrase [Reichenbachiella]MBU2912948.1 carbonic anhydrase [Reichenbachiella agariperforans]RJE72816.1 carbonic anhydrase [Reichenbachiella sp. MSK19-1]